MTIQILMKKKNIPLFCLLLILNMIFTAEVKSQDNPPKILIVTAHPDDDASFAGTNYKIVHDLKGIVDLALITNGEGGYKYSTLAEDIYGIELTIEDTGRKYLPQIRKKELEAGGKIIGIRNYYYFDQKDHRYVTSEFLNEILDSNIWDIDFIKSRLKEIIKKEKYDFVFVMTPTPGTHAHHSASAILALQTIESMDESERPVVLAGSTSSKDDSVKFIYRGLPGYPVTNVSDTNAYQFDRTQKFGYRDMLDYKIIINWLIAEHKSQGTIQLLMNRGDIENYWYLDLNPESGREKTKALFEKLKVNYFPKKEY